MYNNNFNDLHICMCVCVCTCICICRYVRICYPLFFWFAGRLAVILFGLVTLIAGIVLSSIPWVDYVVLKVGYFIFSLFLFPISYFLSSFVNFSYLLYIVYLRTLARLFLKTLNSCKLFNNFVFSWRIFPHTPTCIP